MINTVLVCRVSVNHKSGVKIRSYALLKQVFPLLHLLYPSQFNIRRFAFSHSIPYLSRSARVLLTVAETLLGVAVPVL